MQDLDVMFKGRATTIEKAEFLEHLDSLRVRQIKF